MCAHSFPCDVPYALCVLTPSHHPVVSCAIVLPDSKFTSFQRQLNLYQFKRRKGAHAGAFHHPSFRRGQRHLLSKVRRQKVKRDLAVEARAAQRLARARYNQSSALRSPDISGRGRTRAASQADLRPVLGHEDDEDVSDEEYSPGSRRSAMRRRTDSGITAHGMSGVCTEGDGGASDDACWSNENNIEQRLTTNGDVRNWGEDWRQQIPGSPDRSPIKMHTVSTPMTSMSSEYEYSPSSTLDRTTSVGSSLGSSSSFGSTLGASPTNSDIFRTSPSYRFESEIGDSSSQESPLSAVHTPVVKAVAAVQAAQVSPPDHGLSLAAVVDASVGGWNGGDHQALSLRQHFEPFGWGPILDDESSAPWSDPSSTDDPSAVNRQHQSPPAHTEEFDFIDLFATNWDPTEGVSPSPPSSSALSSTSSGSSLDAVPSGDSRNDAFMKEAEASGVFGVEDYLMPRGGSAVGGYGGPIDYA